MGATVQRYHAVDLLKILLTCGIVLRHSELLDRIGSSASFDVFDKVMMGITEICVPLFFVLSGFLFFCNAPERPDARFFVGKIRRRAVSLLVPYLIANALAFAVYWAANRWTPQLMGGYFGDEWKNPIFIFWTGPVNLSLWFIRDLFLAVLLAPLTWAIVRYARIWGVLAVLLAGRFVAPGPWFNVYFALGAWLAVWKPSWAAYADTLLAGCGIRPPDASWQAWCFFVYLYHYLITLALKKLLPLWFAPEGFWALLGTFAAVFILTMAVLTGVYRIMKKSAPGVLGVVAGGKL